MKVGDLIVTLDSNYLMIGRIIGNAYLSKSSVDIVYDEIHDKKTSMEFDLRRNISWGPEFKRIDIPYAMEMTLRAHQSVFSIDNHWDSVYHLIYPVFSYKDSIYLTANIRQENDINNYSMARFLLLLSDIEVIAKGFRQVTDYENVTFEMLQSFFYSNEHFSLSTKAEFMSAGTVWARLRKLDAKDFAIIAFCYILIFGGQGFGIKVDGIIDVELRHKLAEIVMQRMETLHSQQIVDSLELKLPKQNTEPLESNSKDEKTIIS